MIRFVALVVVVALAGCERFPRDSAGALDRIEREKVVRVGVSDHAPWVTGASAGRPGGLEPQLIEAWASRQGARVEYRTGPLEELVEELHARKLDVLAAGLEARTAFSKKTALSQPYLTLKVDGKTEKHVIAASQGESALLFSLDRFLKAQDEAALRRRAVEARP